MADSALGPMILVIAFRADAHLADCLSYLGPDTTANVVDNEASEQTRRLAESAGARYLAAASNLGFAAAVNLGLRTWWDGISDVLLLNPDARIRPDQVAHLQRALHDTASHRAAVGPRLVDDVGAPQRADWPLPSPGQIWAEALGAGDLWRGPRFVVGAVLLLRAQALRELGWLDERYFLYAEEADWQMRALRAGWSVAVDDGVTAVHFGSASSSDPEVRERLFHGSAEAFARRWYGERGWQLMRAAAVLAASRRSVIGPRTARAHGRRTLGRYLHGPLKALEATAPPGGGYRGRVVHVVRSDSYAGVERYITDTATELHRRGWVVTVVGGDPQRMTAELPAAVVHLAGATVPEVARSLSSLGRREIVHAHMTAAELPAALLKWRYRGRLVVTRHFAASRGRSLLGRLARPVIARRVDIQIAISRFVADSLGESSTVVYNGVQPSTSVPAPRTRTVIALQRLEAEKDTATALRAWAEANLGAEGWRLVIYGRGAQEQELRRLSRALGVAASVEFGGFLDRPRLALAQAGMMLATAPAEPFGLAVVEAMAEGTPVVAARGGAHLETIGCEDVYFAPGDASSCAAVLVRLAHSPKLRDDVGNRLRVRYSDMFAISTHADALEACYRGIGLAPRSGPVKVARRRA